MPLIQTRIESPNGVIWDQVCDCESFGSELKDFLKAVEYGERSFTSIDAYVQIRKATEVFGPMGHGWGIRDIVLISSVPIDKQTRKGAVPGYQMCFKGTFWWTMPRKKISPEKLMDDVKANEVFCGTPGLHLGTPVYVGNLGEGGSFDVMEDIFLDTSGDSMKKVVTGMITKGLSYLGWNYDVFRGRFNDAKSFESPADSGEIARLKELLNGAKYEVRSKIIDYHTKRGWLKSEVLADIKKVESALAAKKERENVGSSNPDGDGAAAPVREEQSPEG